VPLTEPSCNPRGSLPASANFAFLKPYGEGLVALGAQAERYFTDDPVTALVKLRQLAERLAPEAAARVGLFASTEENQVDLLRRLIDRGVTTREVHELFHGIRKEGNAAVHQNEGSHQEALHQLKAVRALAVWFHRSFALVDPFGLTPLHFETLAKLAWFERMDILLHFPTGDMTTRPRVVRAGREA